MRIRSRIASRVEERIASSEASLGAISDKLENNEKILGEAFANCSDLVQRKLELPGPTLGSVVYLSVMVDEATWDNGILGPLMDMNPEWLDDMDGSYEQLSRKLATSIKPSILETLDEAVREVVCGAVVLLMEGRERGLSFLVSTKLHRQLSEPATEAVIRGPRIGFIENVDVNMALLRQYIRSPKLKMERISVGKVSHTEVAIAYLEGYAPQSVLKEIRKRLDKIDLDSAIESGYLEELISDNPYTPFPLVQATERPDSVVGSLIEGKVAILSGGTPMTMVVPVTFWYGFQSAEDYFMNFIFATMLRWLRYLFAFMAIAFPGAFVAITTFHQEMIPTSLALSLASAREIVPFPTMIETIIMEVTFEALREAGVRLPRPVGQTISIVGALVIGQAAVQAGIISAPIIIVVAITGIASFLIPHTGMSQPVSLLRFALVLLGGLFGLYGIMAGMIALLIHLSGLQSFGVPYLWPIAPYRKGGWMDVLVRVPWKYMRNRKWYEEQRSELDRP